MSCPKCGVNQAQMKVKKNTQMFSPCTSCTVVYHRKSPLVRTSAVSVSSLMAAIKDEPGNWMRSWGGSHGI